MFLQRLVLDNIRSIEHLDISFQTESDKIRQWTLLLGTNGVGKSNILKAIALSFAGYDTVQDLLPNPSDWVRHGQKEGKIQATFLTNKGSKRQIELSFIAGDNRRTFAERNNESLTQIDIIRDTMEHAYLTVGYGASRRLSSTNGIKSERFYSMGAQNVTTLFDSDSPLHAVEAWATDLEYRREQEGLQFIGDAFDSLLAGVSFEGIDRDKRELLFKTPDGILPLRLLSEGYQNVIAWWGDFLHRITTTLSELPQLSKVAGLLLIDEIDLHLHPTWQRRLRDFLTEKLPSFQIVATTHSPLTAQQAGEGELFFLKRTSEESAATLHAYTGNPQYLKIEQILTSPAFGLETATSKYVEDLRATYKSLSNQSNLDADESKIYETVSQELAELPDPYSETEFDRKQMALLTEIRDALKK